MNRIDRRRLRGGLLSCGLAVGLLALASPAPAAQIDLTNCQAKQIRICAWDRLGGTGDWGLTGRHVYSEVGETHHFTCDANCKFTIVTDCKSGECAECGSSDTPLDHSWGKGAYQLISLEKNDNGYNSSDLVKVEPGTPCP